MADEKSAEVKDGPSFWRKLEPAPVLTAATAVIVAALGLLGPVSQFVVKRAEHDLAVSAQEHQHLIDFADKLIASDKIADERNRTFYRRDVMKFFAAALKPGELKSFATREAETLETRAGRLQDLQQKETALAEARRAVADAEGKLVAVAEAKAAQAAAKGDAAETLGQVVALRAKDAEVAQKGAAEQMKSASGTAGEVAKLRAELGVGSKGNALLPQESEPDKPSVHTACKQLIADTAIGLPNTAAAEAACRAADRGTARWTARVDAYYVTCLCLQR